MFSNSVPPPDIQSLMSSTIPANWYSLVLKPLERYKKKKAEESPGHLTCQGVWVLPSSPMSKKTLRDAKRAQFALIRSSHPTRTGNW